MDGDLRGRADHPPAHLSRRQLGLELEHKVGVIVHTAVEAEGVDSLREEGQAEAAPQHIPGHVQECTGHDLPCTMHQRQRMGE